MARSLQNRGRPLRAARAYQKAQKRKGKKVGLYAAFGHVLSRKDLSAKQIRRLYKARRAGKTAPFPKSRRSSSRSSSRRSTSRARSRSTKAPKRKLGKFARFLKLNKGRGWTTSVAAHMYNAVGKKAIKIPASAEGVYGPMTPPSWAEETWTSEGLHASAPSFWSKLGSAVGLGSSTPTPVQGVWATELPSSPAQAAANGLALALHNGLALTNPFNAIGAMSAYALGTAIPAVATFYAMRTGVPFLQEHVYNRVSDLVERVPVVGAKTAQVIDAAPHAITGSIVGGVVGLGAVYSLRENLPWQVSAVIGTVGLIAPIVGFYQDWESILDAIRTPANPADAATAGLALDVNGLALENMGALALENLGVPFGNALGDGMAYETAPLTAANVYAQAGASLADAMSCGADFDPSEGTALLNGTWGSVYGSPPVRKAGRAEGESHLARRPGHRWGWLIGLVGWDRARQIAAMSPFKRVKLIAKLRAQAVRTFQQVSAARSAAGQASLAQVRVQEFSPAGGLPTASAPAGAAGAAGPGAELGAPLFL